MSAVFSGWQIDAACPLGRFGVGEAGCEMRFVRDHETAKEEAGGQTKQQGLMQWGLS